jgi:hypothetical protein
MSRLCKIEAAAVETADGRGDASYGLLDEEEGAPVDIALAIQEELEGMDLYGAGSMKLRDNGEELYLILRIKVRRTE